MRPAARLLAVVPALALLAWMSRDTIGLATAGAVMHDVSKAMDPWTAGKAPAPTAIAKMREDLQDSRHASDADIEELLGLIYARSGSEYLAEARVHLINALRLRPGSPYTWANLVGVDYRLGRIGKDFERMLVLAAELGPYEADVQRAEAFYGLALWDEVAPETRAAIERSVASGMKRNPLEMLQISQRRGRLDVACRYFGGSSRRSEVVPNLPKRGGNTMKRISVVLALLALMFTDLALAATAVATSVTGTAQVQTGSSSPRTLRQGDEVSQGDTISTGANSSAVLKFDDGQVAALTGNSRMTITSYQYNPANESGNVLLSLVTGGMRAITGLIGRRAPNQVAFRAATATIGIRGSDGTIVTNGTDVVVTVTDGVFYLKQGDLVLEISAGQAVFTRPGAAPIRGSIASVVAQLPPAFAAAINQSGQLNSVIAAAGAGQARQGGNQDGNNQGGNQDGNNQGGGNTGGQQGGGGGGGGGGGNGSRR